MREARTAVHFVLNELPSYFSAVLGLRSSGLEDAQEVDPPRPMDLADLRCHCQEQQAA